MKKILFLVLCFILSNQVYAQPSVIGFEGVAMAGDDVTSLNPYTEGGFDFYQLDAGLNLSSNFRVVSQTFGGLGLPGSDVGFVQGPANFGILESSAAPFDLTSIQLGGAFGTSGTVTITGTLAAGGSLNEVAMVAAGSFTDVVFPLTWTGLSRVDFSYSSSFLAIDNVDVSLAAALPPVSVPSLSVWMVIVLLLLTGLLTFRKYNYKF